MEMGILCSKTEMKDFLIFLIHDQLRNKKTDNEKK